MHDCILLVSISPDSTAVNRDSIDPNFYIEGPFFPAVIESLHR